jgi:general secretion pathway protein L
MDESFQQERIMPDKILGLDIGDSSIKAVQVSGGLRGYHVTACTSVDVDPGQGVEEALNSLLEKMPSDGATCTASFQTDRVSFRNLSLPFKDEKKIAQTIGFELEPMLPFSVDAVITDYVVADGSEETRVLSASIQQENLEQYLAFLATHDVDPDVVDISGVPIAVQLAKQEDVPPNALFIDIGSRISSAVLFIRSKVVLVRPFRFGGSSLTEAIAKSKKVSNEEAEPLKRGSGAGGLADVVRPTVQGFCQEIQNTLHAFRYEVMEEVYPEKVFLSGGGALYPGMAAMLEGFLEFPVELIDLAQQMGVQVEENASGNWNPCIMNEALAVALRSAKDKGGFNFRVGRFKKTKKYEQLKGEIRRIVIYASVILLVILGEFFADYYVLKKRHNHLQGEIASVFKKTFPDVKRIVDPVHQMKVKMREAKESTLLPAESLVQRALVDVLRDITLRIPTGPNVDVSSLRIKGLTDTFNTVDEIKNGLQESSYFKDVAIASAQLDRKSNKVRFELTMGHK